MQQSLSVDDHIKEKLVHSVHTSERRSFRGCRRRHSWIFRDGYYPVVTVKPLEFGVAFHKAMEKLYDPLTWDDKELAYQLARSIFVQTCEHQFQDFKRAVETGKVSGFVDMDEAKADYAERKELGLNMLYHYAKNEMPKHDTNFKPVKVEIEFEVAITSPKNEQLWCKCQRCVKRWNSYWANQLKLPYESVEFGGTFVDVNDPLDMQLWKGLPVTYGGRIDCLVQDDLGRYWIVDWKTAARLSTGEPGADDDYLWMDDQISSYCWALWSIGFPIAGFIYAELKKAHVVEPEPLARPYGGRAYSTNKQASSTTYELFKTTVEENDPRAYFAGLYDDYLEFLQTKGQFHLRHQIHRSESELRNIGYNIWQEACDITDPNLRIYPSPGRFTCTTCAFKEPCLMMNRNEDYEYTLDTLFDKRERHYYEREASTDSKGGQ